MIISINAGHTISGVGSGAIGYINESQETRVLTNKIIILLKAYGHVVYNDTVDYADSTTDSLKKIVTKVNNHNKVDLFVSIHFNSSVDGKGYGSEIYVYNTKEEHPEASKVLENLQKIGFKNRGIKNGSHLYVVKNTNPKALLIEVCFVNNQSDYEMYYNNVDKVAEAIVEGIAGKNITGESKPQNYISEFEKAKQFVIDNGISDGSNPTENITREQVWTMIYRFYNKFIK